MYEHGCASVPVAIVALRGRGGIGGLDQHWVHWACLWVRILAWDSFPLGPGLGAGRDAAVAGQRWGVWMRGAVPEVRLS